MILLSIQHIPHLSCIFEHFWKKNYFDLHGFSSESKIYLFIFFFFLKISAIDWIESRTKFQNSPIFIFRVMVILVPLRPLLRCMLLFRVFILYVFDIGHYEWSQRTKILLASIRNRNIIYDRNILTRSS